MRGVAFTNCYGFVKPWHGAAGRRGANLMYHRRERAPHDAGRVPLCRRLRAGLPCGLGAALPGSRRAQVQSIH